MRRPCGRFLFDLHLERKTQISLFFSRLSYLNARMFKHVLPLLFFVSPSFAVELRGLDLPSGEPASVSLDGIAVVAFLSVRCPCSESHEAELKRLSQKYTKVKFVGVHSNTDEPVPETVAHFKKSLLPFPVLQDEKGAIADQYKAFKTPHVFLLADGGKVVYQGGVTDSHEVKNAKEHYLADALEDVSGGQPVRKDRGRTLGCSIVR